jgi:long-chain acyl-CoA synthetase
MIEDDVVLHRFYEVARRRPDAPYLTQPLGGGRVEDFSFARALDEAKRIAAYLRWLDLPPGSRIAIVSKNCAHFFLSDLAIWMAGHVSVALYPTHDARTIRYVLDHSESRLLFVGKLDSWEEVRKGVPGSLPCVAYPLAPETDLPRWSGILQRFAPIPDEPRRRPDDLAMILYTSGTTGRPKGVVHSFATISIPSHELVKMLEIGESDRYLSYLPLAHAMERWLGECISFVAGGRIFFAESLDTFVEDLQRARPTLFASVPRLWLKFQHGVYAKIPPRRLERMLKVPVLSAIVKRKVLKGLGLDQVRFAGSGSAPIPAELLAWYRDLGLELLEGYGLTENFSYSHVTRRGEARPGFVGHACEGVECRIDENGEIVVKSPGNMLGYYKDPELTRESFTPDGFLRTGDQGAIVDGQLRITGRVKELFKTAKGKYVAPAPIEGLLAGDGSVGPCCVAGIGQAQPHAVVQLAEHLRSGVRDPTAREATTRALEALIDRVNRQLATYERLAFLAVAKDPWTVDDGCLTPTLKIRRAAIETRYAPALERWYASGRKVIWEDLLEP